MLLLRFDNATDFFAWLDTRTETVERFHTEGAVGDPPTAWTRYPVAREVTGLWIACLDYPLESEDVRWQDSQRISGWLT